MLTISEHENNIQIFNRLPFHLCNKNVSVPSDDPPNNKQSELHNHHYEPLPLTVMVYSHWLGPGPGQGPGPVLCRTFHIAQGPGRMGCMALIRTFHTAPEQGQGRTLVFITGHIFRT